MNLQKKRAPRPSNQVRLPAKVANNMSERKKTLIRKIEKSQRREKGSKKNLKKHADELKEIAFSPVQFESIVNFTGDLDQKTGTNAVGLTPSIDPGTQAAIRLKMGDKVADCVFNGVVQGDVRWPDPFSLVPTTVTRVVTVSQVASLTTSSSSTSANKFLQGIFGGDGCYSLYVNLTNQTTTTFDWRSTDSSGPLQAYQCGICSADFYARPIAMVLDIQPLLVGPVHSITINAIPINAVAHVSLNVADPTGWPIYANVGPSSTQATWGARTWTVKSGEEGVRLVALPADSRGLAFLLANSERYAWQAASAACKWSQWLFWAWGMTDGDSCQVRVSFVEEVFPLTITTTAYAYPRQDRPSDARSFDKSVNIIEKAASYGMSAMRLTSKLMSWTDMIGRGSRYIADLLGSGNSRFVSLGYSTPKMDQPRKAPHSSIDEEKDAAWISKSEVEKQRLVDRFLSANSSSTSSNERAMMTPRKV